MKRSLDTDKNTTLKAAISEGKGVTYNRACHKTTQLAVTNALDTVSGIRICSADLAENSQPVKTLPVDVVVIGGSTQL